MKSLVIGAWSLVILSGCVITPAARDREPGDRETVTTMDQCGNIVERPAAVDEAFKFEFLPIEERR